MCCTDGSFDARVFVRMLWGPLAPLLILPFPLLLFSCFALQSEIGRALFRWLTYDYYRSYAACPYRLKRRQFYDLPLHHIMPLLLTHHTYWPARTLSLLSPFEHSQKSDPPTTETTTHHSLMWIFFFDNIVRLEKTQKYEHLCLSRSCAARDKRHSGNKKKLN